MSSNQILGYQAANLEMCSRIGQGKRWSLSAILLTVGFCLTLHAQSMVTVSTLAALRETVQKSDQKISMKAGRYKITELPDGSRNFPCSGSNNTIGLSGVYINFPVGKSNRAHFDITGSNNTLKGGIFEDTYSNGLLEVTDFSRYNQNRTTLAKGQRGGANIRVSGDGNTIEGIKMTARGSYPYGYGNTYGIGRDNVAGLDKRCGLLITGVGNTVDDCEFQHRAFGHVIYMQRGADKTWIKNTVIEGAVRPSNDLYKETNDDDLPKRFNYQLPIGHVKGLPIPRDVMLNLTEDGIRAYPINGSVTVENCIVKKTRGGIKLYLAKGDVTVRNCSVLDSVIEGYSLPSGGKIINSSGNAAYGPLIYMHFSRTSNHQIDLKILPAPHAVGNHVFAAIRGRGHNIRLTQVGSPIDATLRPIVVGYKARFQFLTTDYPSVPDGYETNYERHYGDDGYEASNMTIANGTDYPMILGDQSLSNTIASKGLVTDLGNNNQVSQIGLTD
ncbi:right-handed parallel beta-helix repeat-containing protein [Verrucomicrobia bacterium]|nr:right-handed parallel beta-helix repeat-containing protein [Verrucomicrobiota bacterium]